MVFNMFFSITPWWNKDFVYRKQLTISNNTTLNFTTNNTEIISINHKQMVLEDKSLSSGNDIRIIYYNQGNNKPLDFTLEPISGKWNQNSTYLIFKLQSNLAPTNFDNKYWIYYGNKNSEQQEINSNNIFYIFDNFSNESFSKTIWNFFNYGSYTFDFGSGLKIESINESESDWANSQYFYMKNYLNIDYSFTFITEIIPKNYGKSIFGFQMSNNLTYSGPAAYVYGCYFDTFGGNTVSFPENYYYADRKDTSYKYNMLNYTPNSKYKIGIQLKDTVGAYYYRQVDDSGDFSTVIRNSVYSNTNFCKDMKFYFTDETLLFGMNYLLIYNKKTPTFSLSDINYYYSISNISFSKTIPLQNPGKIDIEVSFYNDIINTSFPNFNLSNGGTNIINLNKKWITPQWKNSKLLTFSYNFTSDFKSGYYDIIVSKLTNNVGEVLEDNIYNNLLIIDYSKNYSEDKYWLPESFIIGGSSMHNKAAFIITLDTKVRLNVEIYNTDGKKVKTLVDGKELEGYNYITWEGKDDNNTYVSQGIYITKIHYGTITKYSKIHVGR